MNKKQTQLNAIKKHGEILINAFKCDEEPIRLCKALRRLENRASTITLRMCNSGEMIEDDEKKLQRILELVNSLLNPHSLDIPIFINTDPRGYALKIEDEFLRKCDSDSTFSKIPKDWGGYGIIAPEITGVEE